MSQINVVNLTFNYEGDFENVFENVSFTIDTNWKLGFIGRNGKGKTTFLNLLLGKYHYQGNISSSVRFDYFPYNLDDYHLDMCIADILDNIKSGCESWKVICELDKLGVSAEVLYRPFSTLSNGEQTKVMLAILFSDENDFLLIDEPTNHLDIQAREVIKEYLSQKKGFILISHDRDLLDGCVDHILSLNKKSIQIQSGNFTSWWENKKNIDNYNKMQNNKHLQEIASLKRTASQSKLWAGKNEQTKIGFDPIKEHERDISTRSYIGAKTKKMQSRVKQFERRIERNINEMEGLLQDIENPVDLKIQPLQYHKDILVSARNLNVTYDNKKTKVICDMDFEIKQGERIFINGKNGCGKSTLIKAIMDCRNHYEESVLEVSGELRVGSGLVISYVNQNTDFLRGGIKEYCSKMGIDETLTFTLLNQLGMDRSQFTKPIENFSQGQKKKVLLASSLVTQAHLYIWDEPLNYLDIFSRIQIENLILKFQPTMIVVEHDVKMRENVATRILNM